MPETHATETPAPKTIRLYTPAAVGIGVLGSVLAAAFGAAIASVAGAQGDSLVGGAAVAALLAASWLLPWAIVALTGPYQLAIAGMAWLALSTARLLVLVVAGIVLALVAPTMGLGLWLALLCGGLAAVAIDTAMAMRSLRGLGPQASDTHASDADSLDSNPTTPSTQLASGGTT
ncbi:MAG: hypothetical protein AAFV77_11070 [Planctomycetota bacterium]